MGSGASTTTITLSSRPRWSSTTRSTPTAAPRSKATSEIGPLRALIVEDDPDIREILTDILTDRGHDVVALADGAEASARLRHEHFPLVVLDWMLPGVDGLELCRSVRTQPNGDRVFLVVATAR